jgi:hypothetical protein
MSLFANVLCCEVYRCVAPLHSVVFTFSLLSKGICCLSRNPVVLYVGVNIHTVLVHQIHL